MNRLILFCLSVFIFLGCNKNETPKPDESGLFVKFFGGPFDDQGFSVARAADGGFYLAGSTLGSADSDTNIIVVKIDQFGNKSWDKRYDLDDRFDEVARDIIVDSNGDIIVAGYKRNIYGYTDYLIMRIYENDLDNPESYVFGDSLVDEKAFNLVQSDDGAFIVYGSVMNDDAGPSMTSDMYLLKTNLTDTVWNRQIGVLSYNDDIGTMKINDDGDLLWCGTAHRVHGNDMRIVFADDFGNIMWDYGYEENDMIHQYGYDMYLAEDGYVIAGSKNRSETSLVKDIFIVRTSQNGLKSTEHLNTIIIAEGVSQEAYSLTVVDNSTYVITGYTTTERGDKDILVMKIDANGNVISRNSFGGAGEDEGNKILKTDNGYIIIGTIYAGNNKMVGVYKVNEELELIP